MSCVIITYTGVHHIVTEEQANQFASLAPDGEASFNGNLIKYKNVADILSLEKYYEAYPDKRPERQDIFKTLPGYGMNGIIKYSSKNALKGIIKGLKKYIASTPENPCVNWRFERIWYQGTSEPISLLEKMETKQASTLDN